MPLSPCTVRTRPESSRLVGGPSLDNAKAVEKAARNVVKGQNFAKLVQLDVAKVGDINIHKVALLSVFPERDRVEIAKAFGPDAGLRRLRRRRGLLCVRFRCRSNTSSPQSHPSLAPLHCSKWWGTRNAYKCLSLPRQANAMARTSPRSWAPMTSS